MDDLTIKKLRMPVYQLEAFMTHSVRVMNTCNNANLSEIIHIYRFQQEHGGFSKNKRRGLLRCQNFGRKSLNVLGQALMDFGLPGLEDAEMVLREFDKAANNNPSKAIDSSARLVIEKTLKELGRKHDPDTLEKVMQITS